MQTINLLFRRDYAINDTIRIQIPTVGEVLEDEDGYYSLVSILTAMPIDFMVQLDDLGIDFTQINEYELFLLLFPSIQKQDAHLVFGDLDRSKFKFAQNESTGQTVLLDDENDIVIDRLILGQIAATLRKIHNLEKNRKKPGNKEAKEYMLERARQKMRRNKNRRRTSQLEALIVAMVNTEQYKYDFEGTKELSIYQFNESVRQVIKKVDYDNRMFGVYTGNIDAKKLSRDELTWLNDKST